MQPALVGTPTIFFPASANPPNSNPHITVTLQVTNLPTFFGRIWGNRTATVTASATAEAYNPAIHQPPPANPLAIQFFVAVSASHFAAFFFAVQVLGGLLLLSGYFPPLTLTALAAELYNILAFHPTLSPATIASALVASVPWVLVFLQYRESFKGTFSAKPATQP
jgi:putative oxidoreductase